VIKLTPRSASSGIHGLKKSHSYFWETFVSFVHKRVIKFVEGIGVDYSQSYNNSPWGWFYKHVGGVYPCFQTFLISQGASGLSGIPNEVLKCVVLSHPCITINV